MFAIKSTLCCTALDPTSLFHGESSFRFDTNARRASAPSSVLLTQTLTKRVFLINQPNCLCRILLRYLILIIAPSRQCLSVPNLVYSIGLMEATWPAFLVVVGAPALYASAWESLPLVSPGESQPQRYLLVEPLQRVILPSQRALCEPLWPTVVGRFWPLWDRP